MSYGVIFWNYPQMSGSGPYSRLAITCINVDPDTRREMESLGQNELIWYI